MADSGWSWSPAQALSAMNPGMASHPAVTMNTPTGISLSNLLNPIGNENMAMPPPPRPRIENMAPNTMNSIAGPAPKSTLATRKRKSNATGMKEDLFPDNVPEIPDDDARLEPTSSDTCSQVRRKIKAWTGSGAMKVGEFQKAINVSAREYSSFMNQSGTWGGEFYDTYRAAHAFFKKRELQGLPLKASSPKRTQRVDSDSGKKPEEMFDVSGVELPREEAGQVPVYDTCDEVRKKIRNLLARDGITQAAFVREISKTFKDGRKVSPANLRYFMGRKGILDGNSNITFYAGYVFFEKKRIKAGNPKTKFREGMERAHGAEGVNIKYSSNGYITLFENERAYPDEYGKLEIVTVRSW